MCRRKHRVTHDGRALTARHDEGGAPDEGDCLLTERGAEVLLLPSSTEPFSYPWRFLFDSLSSEHWPRDHAAGHCYRTLVVGVSSVLDFRYPGR